MTTRDHIRLAAQSIARNLVEKLTDPDRWSQTEDDVKESVIQVYQPDIEEMLIKVGTEIETAIRGRIASMIRLRSVEAKGKCWYHPEHELNQLAKDIEANR